MTNTELKPCPFCGGEAHLRTRPKDGRRRPIQYEYYVVCLGSFSVSKCRTRAATKMCVSPEEAADAWNTRADIVPGARPAHT